MNRPASRSATPRRGPTTVRHARNEEIGHVVACLQKAGPRAVHTVRSVATMMYGDDCILENRHISAARRMVDKIIKFGLPLTPCDEDAVAIGTGAAKARGKSGGLGQWRYDPYANEFGEAILEGMGDRPLVKAAMAVLTLESAELTDVGGGREVQILLDAIRGLIPPATFPEAKKELAARRLAAAGSPRRRASGGR